MRAWSRLGAQAVVLCAAGLVGAAPADAKMPYFSLTLEPTIPAAGEPTLVVVRLWEDPAHTKPASWPLTTLGRLIAIRSDTGAAPDIEPTLGWNQTTERFEATVVFPAAGSWTLVAFPDRSGWSSPEVSPGYPDTIPITVVPSGGISTLPSGATARPAEPYLGGAVAAVAVAVAMWLLGRRRYSGFA